MGASEKFCLKWNDFQENISSAFRELRDDSDFFDVTLACGDDASSGGNDSKRTIGGHHRLVRAHKVILSSCSVFFKEILRSMSTASAGQSTQPLIYLRGIKYDDLQSILDFMYFGEVNIAQEKLNTFLAVAEELRVKGLSLSESGQKPPPTPSSATTSSASLAATKRPIKNLTPNAIMNHAKKQRVSATKLDDSMNIKFEASVTKERLGSASSSLADLTSNAAAAASIHSGGAKFDDDFSGNERSMDAFSGGDEYLDNLNDGGGGGADGSDGNKEYDEEDLDGEGYGYEPEAEVMIEEGEDDLDMSAATSSGAMAAVAAPRMYDVITADYQRRIRQLIKIDRLTNQPYCTLCNQTGSNYETVSNHVEARHIQRREYLCQYCGKGFKTKNHKAVHIHRVHREEHKLAKVFGTAAPELN